MTLDKQRNAVERLRQRAAQARKRAKQLSDDYLAAETKLRLAEGRETLQPLVGSTVWFVSGTRFRNGIRPSFGTLVSVKRKRAVVAIDGTEWDVPLSCLKSSAEAELSVTGTMMLFGG